MNTGTWCACCSEPVRDGDARVGSNGGYYCAACGDPGFYEYSVSDRYSGLEVGGIHSAQEAISRAVARSISCGREQEIDLMCGSRAAAHVVGELSSYDEDPEASVTRRIIISAKDLGRIA